PSDSACCASSTVRAQASAGGQPSYSPFQPCGAMSPTCMSYLHRLAPGHESCHGCECDGSAVTAGARTANRPRGPPSAARILGRMEMTAFDPELPLPDMP